MAASSILNRLSTFLYSAGQQITEYLTAGDSRGALVEFPLENVIRYEGDEKVAENVNNDVKTAYTKHSRIKEFLEQNVDKVEESDQLVRILRSSKDPVETIVSMIFLTAKLRQPKDVEYLLRLETYAGAPLSFQNDKLMKVRTAVFESGLTILHHVVMGTVENKKVLSSLLHRCNTPESLEIAAGERNLTPLLLAAFAGSSWAIPALLEAGADATKVDKSLSNVLHLASSSIRDGVSGGQALDTLLSSRNEHIKAAINDVNADGHTPVTLASALGDAEALRVLLSYGANADSNGFSPLCYAALSGSPTSIKLLLEHGAAINDRDKDGLTALGIVARNGDAESLKALLEQQHDAAMVTSAFELALTGNHFRCAFVIALKNLNKPEVFDIKGALRSAVTLGVDDLNDEQKALYSDLLSMLIRSGGLQEDGLDLFKLAAQKENQIAYNLIMSGAAWKKQELKVVSEATKESSMLGALKNKIKAEQKSCCCCFAETDDMIKFSPCGHIETCKDCYERLLDEDEPRCPTCREPLDVDKCELANL